MEDAVIKALDSSTPDTSKLQALQKSLEAMLQFGAFDELSLRIYRQRRACLAPGRAARAWLSVW